ncbi:MAG: metallophosphoesterase [Verrucomicrobiales bacterium]
MRTLLRGIGPACLCLLAGSSQATDPDAVPGFGTARIDETGIVTGVLDRQRQWFAAEVAASTARWKIACFHHSPYGSDSYGGHARMQWPEFSSLDAIFCGHDHLYERLVYHADEGDTDPLLFVTGHGGASLYRSRDTAP